MKYLVALAALLCAAPVSPQEAASHMPPLRFQGVGMVPVLYVPAEMVERVCGMKPAEGKRIVACVRSVEVEGRTVHIVVQPDPCPRGSVDYYALIACHENAHFLKGWKHEPN